MRRLILVLGLIAFVTPSFAGDAPPGWYPIYTHSGGAGDGTYLCPTDDSSNPMRLLDEVDGYAFVINQSHKIIWCKKESA